MYKSGRTLCQDLNHSDITIKRLQKQLFVDRGMGFRHLELTNY